MPVVTPHSGDWTDSELTQIERLKAVCESSRLLLECLQTDEGDPWCVVYCSERNAVVVHIARINRKYVVGGPPNGTQIATTSIIEAAIEIALAAINADVSRSPPAGSLPEIGRHTSAGR